MKRSAWYPWFSVAMAAVIVMMVAGCSPAKKVAMTEKEKRIAKMEKDLAVLKKITTPSLSFAEASDAVIVLQYPEPKKVMTNKDTLGETGLKATAEAEEPIKIPIPPDRRMGDADIYYFTDGDAAKSNTSSPGMIEVLRGSITEKGYFKVFHEMKKGEQYILIRFPDTYGTATSPDADPQ
jgi:hypothetical protein